MNSGEKSFGRDLTHIGAWTLGGAIVGGAPGAVAGLVGSALYKVLYR